MTSGFGPRGLTIECDCREGLDVYGLASPFAESHGSLYENQHHARWQLRSAFHGVLHGREVPEVAAYNHTVILTGSYVAYSTPRVATSNLVFCCPKTLPTTRPLKQPQHPKELLGIFCVEQKDVPPPPDAVARPGQATLAAPHARFCTFLYENDDFGSSVLSQSCDQLCTW